MGVPPRLDSGTLVIFFVFDALAGDHIQNGPFSGAVAEKDVASEARHAPVPGGAGASKMFLFSIVFEKRYTPRIGKSENFQIVGLSKIA